MSERQPPQLVEVRRVQGRKNEGSYIVHLKPGIDKAAHIEWLRGHFAEDDKITFDYPAAFSNSFAGKFCQETVDALRACPDVESISEDAVGSIF
ncbi:hypothetical protein BV20DRAFT_649057 [Pilatotrama ljubarskyi]|nr:hypothetical protein BV20DRAFT_649057 [Pilatotrama ljubarskyi]